MDSLLNTYLTILKMSENDPRYESMLFNYETTMKDSYRNGAILNVQKTVYEEKPKCLWARPPPLKDIHTLTDWKTPNMPIDLFVKPKEVVRDDPRKAQKPCLKLEDVDKDQVRKTRPRLVMTPAVSMDDIEDERKRAILTDEVYTTSTNTAARSGAATERERVRPVQAPLPGTLSPANPITIRKLQFPYVSPEWRVDSARWDARQLRAACRHERDLYLAAPLRCAVCVETAAREAKKKMLKKMKADNII